MIRPRTEFVSTGRHPSYQRYWLHLYRREVNEAGRLVSDAFKVWMPQRIYMQLFEPALKLSGSLWARGRISYHDEHFVTHHTLRFMRQVRRRFVPSETFGPLAVVVGVQSERHLVGLQMVCDFLQWANWRVHRLSSCDPVTVSRVVERLRPDALLLSLGTTDRVEPAKRLIAEIRRHEFNGMIVVGGHAINSNPSLVAEIGADFTMPNGAALVQRLRPRRAWHISGRLDRCEMPPSGPSDFRDPQFAEPERSPVDVTPA